MKSHSVQHLRRPQSHDDVCLVSPAPDIETVGQCSPEIGAFGVERSSRLLQVREPRPVLEVKKRQPIGIPGDDIRPPRELEMLIWLVDGNSESMGPKAGGFQFTHGRMDRIRGSRGGQPTPWGGGQDDLSSEAERDGHPSVGVERPRSAALEAGDLSHRESTRGCEPPHRPTSAEALLADRGAELRGEALALQPRTSRGRLDRAWRRHLTISEQDPAWLGLLRHLSEAHGIWRRSPPVSAARRAALWPTVDRLLADPGRAPATGDDRCSAIVKECRSAARRSSPGERSGARRAARSGARVSWHASARPAGPGVGGGGDRRRAPAGRLDAALEDASGGLIGGGGGDPTARQDGPW
jgi:hypothetical protein